MAVMRPAPLPSRAAFLAYLARNVGIGSGIIGGCLGAGVLGYHCVVGLPWLAVVAGFSPAVTIEKGLLPFVFGDVIKLVLAAVLFPAAWWVVGRRPGER